MKIFSCDRGAGVKPVAIDSPLQGGGGSFPVAGERRGKAAVSPLGPCALISFARSSHNVKDDSESWEVVVIEGFQAKTLPF